MPFVVESPPDRHGFCPEAPVRKADDERAAGPQNASDLAQHRHRLLQILDRHADHRRIDVRIRKRQRRVAVQVLDEPAVEPRIGGQFGGIHAVADHFGINHFRRQMADPAAHQIEQDAARGQYAAIELRQRGNCPVVDVMDEPGRLVKKLVLLPIDLGEGALRQS